MDSWYVLSVFGTVIIAAVGGMLIAVSKGLHRWPVTAQPSAMPADLQLRVRRLLGAEKADQAVKEVRELTGLKLKDAKGVVDGLRSDQLSEIPAAAAVRSASLAERA